MSQQMAGGFATADSDDEVHFIDLMVILAQQKWVILITALVGVILAVVISFLITPMYTSSVKFMPPQQQQSAGVAAMLGQLGGLAGAMGGIGAKSSADTYVGVLESRTVADRLITRFGLMARYKKSTMAETRKMLSANTMIANGKKDGFITVAVEDVEPAMAATLANAYVEELVKLTSTLALTEASQRRVFFEKQLSDVKDQLAGAEVALRRIQERTGLIQPGAQVSAIISTATQLKATIAAKEIQVKSMRTFAASQNPELLRAMEELKGLQVQLAKLERTESGGKGDLNVPTGKIPEIGVDYVRGARDVKYYETIFELLAKQYELAKIDEAKESALVQVLDPGLPAEQKTKPHRSVIVIVGAILGLMTGLVLAFARHIYRNARRNPANTVRWQNLSSAWRGARV